MKTLFIYSLIESHEFIESCSIYSIIHDCCTELISRGQKNNIILVSIIIGSAMLNQSESEYWFTQQRLLLHADRCIKFLLKLNTSDETGCPGSNDGFYNLGLLYADQRKMVEAEKMYQRAQVREEREL